MYIYTAIAVALVIAGWVIRGLWDDSLKLIAMEVAEASQQAAAKEIAKIDVKNTVIHNKIIERTFHEPIYQDCKHSDEDYERIRKLFHD